MEGDGMTQDTGSSAVDISLDAGSQAFLSRIMQRMSESGGFPALDHSVTTIVDALELGEEDTTPLINAVLADVSLTQKVLRLANSAMYAPIGGGVSTVSHAVNVLGFEAVGHLALGAKLIGSMGQLSTNFHAAEKALAHSLLAGSVASSVVSMAEVRGGEIGVVCSLLHRLGELLVTFYLPEEWTRIQMALDQGKSESEATRAVLGVGMQDLGVMVARQWRLPARIVGTMQANGASAGEPEHQWLWALTHFADESARVAASPGEPETHRLNLLAERFSEALALKASDLVQAVKAAADDVTAEPLLASILAEDKDVHPHKASPADALTLLKVGARDVRQAMGEGESSLEVQRIILEVAFSALDLGRAAVFLLDGLKQSYRVTATLCEKAPNRLVGYSIPVSGGSDLAHVALARKADIYIDNPRDPKIAAHFPDWIKAYNLHPFFLLPITAQDGRALGLLYGQQKNDSKLTKEVLGQLAVLRALLQEHLHEGATG